MSDEDPFSEALGASAEAYPSAPAAFVRRESIETAGTESADESGSEEMGPAVPVGIGSWFFASLRTLFEINTFVHLSVVTIVFSGALLIGTFNPIAGMVLFPLMLFGVLHGTKITLELFGTVAKGDRVLESSPDLNPLEWGESLFVFLGVVLGAMAPTFFVSTILMLPFSARFAASLLGVYALMPVIWLTISQSDGAMVLASRVVLQSLSKKRPVWRCFYSLSALVFGIWFCAFGVAIPLTPDVYVPITIAVVGALLLWSLFFYGVLLGLLADALSE